MSNVQSYNALIDRFHAFASGHFILKRFSHGQIEVSDLEKFGEYPFMHVVPSNVTYSKGMKTFSFQIVLADMPRDKEEKSEYQREVLSDLQRIAEDLVAEITNHRVLFGDLITVQNVSLEPFLEEFQHTLTGWTISLDLLVPYYWDACSIPAEWNDFFESGSGGTGSILTFIDSITRDENGNVSLVNDEANPSPNYYYGTNDEGVRGWYLLTDEIGLTCETIGDCQTIIDIEAAIDALEEEILLKADISSISAVGFSNDYNDLDNKPTIPDAQVNSDWNATSGVAEILNKPTIPTTLPPSGAAGGDLQGTYPNPTVHRVHGVDFQSGAPAVDDTWIYVSTPLGPQPFQWQHSKLKTSQVQNDSTVTGTNADDALEHLDSSKVPTTRTISTTAPLSGGGDLSANRTLSITQANTSTNGFLSSTDWNTFNNKQAALVSGTNIKTINGNSVLGSGDLVVGGTQVGYRGFKYNISVYQGGLPFPNATSGQAIILFYCDSEGCSFEGISISQTDANGLNAPIFILSELNKQPLTLFTGATSYVTFNNIGTQFIGGAYRINGNSYGGVDPSTLDGQVGYFDFGTSLPELVSGSTIKTINGSSVLGSGNLVVSASPSGVAGAIQFSNGSAFSSDAANLFWDDTNNRLGIGTNAPASGLSVITSGATYAAIFGGQSATPFWVGIGTASTATAPVIQGFNNGFAAAKLCLNSIGGNVLIGTTADSGYRLDVNGTARTFGSISAASGVARGIFVSNTLIATANNDVLVGLDVAPTFTTGAFTNVQTESLVVRGGGNVLMRFKNATATATWGQISATSNAFNLNSQAGSLSFTSGNTDAMVIFNSTRNVLIQNGGTFTDAGFRLDVVGTARVQSLSASNATSSAILAGFGDTGFANAMYFQNAGIPNRTIFRGFSSSNEVFRIDVSSGAVFGSGTIEASAQLTVTSTTKGFLPPRMTTTQKNAIASPAAGLVVYDTTLNKLCVRTVSAWETITSI